jgi:hypothetical protein
MLQGRRKIGEERLTVSVSALEQIVEVDDVVKRKVRRF